MLKPKTSYALLTIALPISVFAEQSGTDQILPLITVSDSRGLDLPGRSVLTQKNIDIQQADNAADLVNVLPGVNMAGGFRPGGQTLNIQGMGDAEDVRIQLDGANKTFEKYQQGSVFIEPELLKRVSVDKGNFSPRYGNGGFAGTVKFETKDATDFLGEERNLGGLLKYGYNTNNDQRTYSGAAFLRNDAQNIDSMLYASVREAHDYQRPDHSPIHFSANNQRSFLWKTNWAITPEHLLTLSAVYSQHHAWEPFAAKRDLLPAPSERDIAKYGLDLAWKRKLVYREQKDQTYSVQYKYAPENNPWLNLAVQLSYAKTSQNDSRPEEAGTSFIGSLGNASWTTYTDWSLDLNNTSNFKIADTEHALLVGLQWLKHKRDTMMLDKSKLKKADYNFGMFQPYYMPAGSQHTQALYVQDQIQFGDFLFSLGTRYDHIQNQGVENWAKVYNNKAAGHDYSKKSYQGWSYYAGVLYQLNKQTDFFFNFSQTWRAPVIDEQYETQYNQSSVPATSRHLEKERINQFRIGNTLNFEDIFLTDDLFQLRTSYFYNRGKNEIFKTRGVLCAENASDTSNNVCTGLIGNYRNLPGYRIQGLEIEANYQSTYFFGNLNYSYVKGKRDASPRNPWAGNETWIAEIPPRKLSVTLGANVPQWDLSFGWRGDFLRHQDRSPMDGDPKASYWALPKSQGYSLHNVFISWQPKQLDKLVLRVSVDNLFNKSYYPYLGELASGTGRNIKFSISKQF